MIDGPEHGTHWLFHWSPILVLLWPFVALFHSILTLQILQVALILACGPLVYSLARTRVAPAIAMRLALLTLLYPPLLSIAFEEFHELAFLPVLVLAGALALVRRKYAWYALLVLLGIGVREDVCLTLAVVMVALFLYWLQRDRARAYCALATCTACVAALALYYVVVIPRSGGAWQPGHFYTYAFAATPFALLAAFFTMPARVLEAVVTFGRFTYLLEAFVPLLFVPFRSRMLWLALPAFAVVLLANSGVVWRMGGHYAALWIPWVLLALIFACANPNFARARRWLNAMIVISFLALIFTNPMHPGHYLHPDYRNLGAARRALACIPRNAGVDTHDEWYSAMVARHPGATINDLSQPYWLFATDYPNRAFQRTTLPQISAALVAHRYRILCRHGSVKAYARLTKRDRSRRGLRDGQARGENRAFPVALRESRELPRYRPSANLQ